MNLPEQTIEQPRLPEIVTDRKRLFELSRNTLGQLAQQVDFNQWLSLAKPPRPAENRSQAGRQLEHLFDQSTGFNGQLTLLKNALLWVSEGKPVPVQAGAIDLKSFEDELVKDRQNTSLYGVTSSPSFEEVAKDPVRALAYLIANTTENPLLQDMANIIPLCGQTAGMPEKMRERIVALREAYLPEYVGTLERNIRRFITLLSLGYAGEEIAATDGKPLSQITTTSTFDLNQGEREDR